MYMDKLNLVELTSKTVLLFLAFFFKLVKLSPGRSILARISVIEMNSDDPRVVKCGRLFPAESF